MTPIKQAALAVVIGTAMLGGSGGFVPQAQAGFVATLVQSGPNVVATGVGTIDLAGLSLNETTTSFSGIIPIQAVITLGPPSTGTDIYDTGPLTGPSSIGSGGETLASSGSGDRVGLAGPDFDFVYVPEGYVSGNPLSNTSTYNNQTFSTLGVNPGTYVWTWENGAADDSFTLNVGTTSIPEPATLVLVALPLALSLFAARRRAL